MKFPFNEILCFIIGLFISAILTYIFDKLVKKYDIGFHRILRFFPEWLGGLIIILLVLALLPLFFWRFSWAFYACKYLIEKNIKNSILCIIFNLPLNSDAVSQR